VPGLGLEWQQGRKCRWPTFSVPTSGCTASLTRSVIFGDWSWKFCWREEQDGTRPWEQVLRRGETWIWWKAQIGVITLHSLVLLCRERKVTSNIKQQEVLLRWLHQEAMPAGFTRTSLQWKWCQVAIWRSVEEGHPTFRHCHTMSQERCATCCGIPRSLS